MKTNKSLPLPQSLSGLMGKIFGKLMEWTNTGAYQQALETLAPAPNQCFLELGFGTGRFAELLLLAHPDIFVTGLDPTPTMVQTAIELAIDLFQQHGYVSIEHPAAGSSQVIRAVRLV